MSVDIEKLIRNMMLCRGTWSCDSRQKNLKKRMLYFKDDENLVFMNNGVLFLKHFETTYLVLDYQKRNLDENLSSMESLPIEQGRMLLRYLQTFYINGDIRIEKGYGKVYTIDCPTCEHPMNNPVRPRPNEFVGKLYQKRINGGRKNFNKFHREGLCNCIRREWNNIDQKFRCFTFNGPKNYGWYCQTFGNDIWCRECFYYDEPDPNRRLVDPDVRRTKERERSEMLLTLEKFHNDFYKTNEIGMKSAEMADRARTVSSCKRRNVKTLSYISAQEENIDSFGKFILGKKRKINPHF